VARKIKAVITQPVHDRYGEVVFQPGTYLDPDDERLRGLPEGTYRHVVVDEPDADVSEPDPEPEPEPEPEPSVPAEPGIVQLRAEAERLGIKVDGRWSAIRLQQEIANKERSST
jgi:hypothetical protein